MNRCLWQCFRALLIFEFSISIRFNLPFQRQFLLEISSPRLRPWRRIPSASGHWLVGLPSPVLLQPRRHLFDLSPWSAGASWAERAKNNRPDHSQRKKRKRETSSLGLSKQCSDSKWNYFTTAYFISDHWDLSITLIFSTSKFTQSCPKITFSLTFNL